MYVRDAMTTVVLTAGPDHTLREAARRMTARGVGAAVVIDEQQAGPGIITERDILRSIGGDEAPDEERVSGHLTTDVILVVDGADVVGILSMRDIVRCWTAEGATAELASGAGPR